MTTSTQADHHRCVRCTLPATHPGADLDAQGFCAFCRNNALPEAQQNAFDSEDALAEALAPFKHAGKKYDVVVPLSGGVDSSFALIRIVEKFGLRALAFHNDHGFEDSVATANVRKLCASLDVDLVLWQHDIGFMKALWRHLNTSPVLGLSGCYLCGNIIYLNALAIAESFGVPLVINGYTKGQAGIVNQRERGLDLFAQFLKHAKHDREFTEELLEKYRVLERRRDYSSPEDFAAGPTDKILVVPFFLFKFYKTDKELLQAECRRRFDWQPMATSYPARTTNCKMIWLNTYVDIKKTGSSIYDEEYASLVRAGEMSRDQAISDLEHNPPPGLVESLAQAIDLDLDTVPGEFDVRRR